MDKSSSPYRELTESILKTLAYYDLFSYPLTASEVFTNLPTNHVTLEDVGDELENMTSLSMIFKLGPFYSLQNEPALEIKRSNGNRMAQAYMIQAARQAQVIGRFPFVRSVMISGSLSKGYADEESDIDFFIITNPRRLWIARTLLVIYKRLFLYNSHKFFCVNYFIDSDHLEIDEKNLFTATELSTLIPLYGYHLHGDLITQNQWIKNFFPNFSLNTNGNPKVKDGWIKKGLESIINLFFPTVIDRFFMRTTLRRWKRMYSHSFSKEDFELAFKTNQYASKNHPRNFQRRIVKQYEEKIHSLIFALKPA